MEKWIVCGVFRADRLAAAARAAAEAGDAARAAALRRDFDTVYDELEARLDTADRDLVRFVAMAEAR